MTRLTISNIRQQHTAAGYHYFGADEMRCFGSRPMRNVNNQHNNVYFVDERDNYNGTAKIYQVNRFLRSTKEIRQVNEFDSREDAITFLRSINADFDAAISASRKEVQKGADINKNNGHIADGIDCYTDACALIVELRREGLCY